VPNEVLAEKYSARSAEHYAAAERLNGLDDEWGAVCYFYAAYVAARAALYRDVRLDSDPAARRADSKLTASSRHVDFHNGHPNRGLGMNQVVSVLYPSIGSKYELLHIQSVEVRYGSGLVNASLADIKSLADDVLALFRSVGVSV
jgi:hypothetical protein